ncbi:MAG: hypothetical protein QM761_10130 [Pseudoxanthomonas sp.]
MFEQLLSLLGKPFVLPAAFLLIGAWTINKLSVLHDSRRRNRIEFLDRWQSVDDMDDMRLEVTMRHLVGTYLPADIIRKISRTPFPTQTLLDLVAIWPLVRFDHLTGQLNWKKQEFGDPVVRRWLRVVMMLGYVVLALIAVFFFYLAVGTDPSRPTAWISGLNTLMFVVLAGSCLARFDTLGDIGKHGATLIARINAAVPE